MSSDARGFDPLRGIDVFPPGDADKHLPLLPLAAVEVLIEYEKNGGALDLSYFPVRAVFFFFFFFFRLFADSTPSSGLLISVECGVRSLRARLYDE